MSYVVAGILGLALLMVVHEAGHLFAARAFGMRVLRFSIGFGPPIFRYQAKGSETVYQVAIIPFLAYVQIAGMNPFEEVDPDDKGSYANGSLIGRISAIVAGPLANYVFASVFFFGSFIIGGKIVRTMNVHVEDGPAKAAHVRDGDLIVSVGGAKVDDWEELRRRVMASPNKPIEIGLVRDSKPLTVRVTPVVREGRAIIGVQQGGKQVPVGVKEAAIESLVWPAKVVEQLVITLGRYITLKDKPQFSGPVGIVKEASRAAAQSPAAYLWFFGVLSAYLAGFNLLPFPALDGGRLAFLAYEAVTRQRPNAQVEAKVHFLGLLMLLALIAVVTVFDFASIRGN
ncbi:MAG TPA: M50 family metallopeptidase [Polyangiaceae bacterium]